MRHLKTTTTVPMIVGAQGIIKKRTDKHINKIPDSPSPYEMPKIALCGTAHLLRRIVAINVTEKYQPKEAAKNLDT